VLPSDRVTETYGEDPYLVSAMSVAFTRGMQGQDLREGVIACAKHFLGYAQTEAGQNMAAVSVGPRELRLPADRERHLTDTTLGARSAPREVPRTGGARRPGT
jgi:hypothetical protein